MTAVIYLVQVTVAEVEDPTTVLGAKVPNRLLHGTFNEVRLIGSVVLEHLSGEQAQHGDEAATANRRGDVTVQRETAHERAMAHGNHIIRAAIRPNESL